MKDGLNDDFAAGIRGEGSKTIDFIQLMQIFIEDEIQINNLCYNWYKAGGHFTSKE